MNDAFLPDYDIANRFFDALTVSKDEVITFQFFDDKDKKNKTKAICRHMKRSPTYDFLLKKQKEGCGVYVMVNAGDGIGRKKQNVVKVRALFVDLDGSPWEPATAALKPHMRVESSPGRWHLYWLVDDCNLGRFKAIQQAIAKKFNGDKSCCDLPRVLRVPGFYHLKKQPVMTALTEVNSFPRYSTQQVIDNLGLDLTASGKEATVIPKENQEKLAPAFSMAYAYTVQKTGEVIDLAAWAIQNPGFDIVGAIKPEYALGQVVDGKQHIICPFNEKHTDTAQDLATFIVNADTAHPSFNIHCCHGHCADRDRLEFLQAMLQDGWLSASILIQAPLKMKRPPRIYIPIDEIHASIEWTILSHEEHR
ncbi:MAG: RepB family DNA primase, partial [Proteobacteria bacterium]|nr:RepB family DNA primase [Pseudomonadota bacterium]